MSAGHPHRKVKSTVPAELHCSQIMNATSRLMRALTVGDDGAAAFELHELQLTTGYLVEELADVRPGAIQILARRLAGVRDTRPFHTRCLGAIASALQSSLFQEP